MSTMYDPPHPGVIIKLQLIEDEDGNLIESISNVAQKLDCHRNTLNRVINGSASVSAKMALDLERIGAGSAEMWLGLQMSYDLFQLRNKSEVA